MTRWSWVLVAASIASAFPVSPAAGADPRPIVAVFDVQAKRVRLGPEVLQDLSDHLATLLTSSGRYQVVPRSELRARLQQQKVQSYKECFDQSCQVALGRELAAEKTLSAKVMKLGQTCTVNLTLYDLSRATTEKAASKSKHGGCGVEAVLGLLEAATTELVGGAIAQPAGSGRVRIVADVQGARVSVDGEARGFSPLTVAGLSAGEHLARVEADGEKPWQQTFVIRKGEQTLLVAELAPKKHKRSFKDKLKAGLGSAVEIGADVVGVTRDTAIEVHHKVANNEPPAPFEVRQPGGDAVWLRCPLGQTWDGQACAGQADRVPFFKARSACPSGFKLPVAEELTGLLGSCDAGATAGKAGRCAACKDGPCAQMFGDDESRYWTLSWDPDTGQVRTVSLSGEVAAAKPDARFSVRCIRRR